MRLLPGGALLQMPPRVDDTDKSTWSLIISIDGEDRERVEDMLFECVCFGAPEEIIRAALDEETPQERFNIMRNYLVDVYWNKPAAERGRIATERAEILSAGYRLVGGIELEPQQLVSVRLEKDRDPCSVDGPQQPSVRVRQKPGIQNFGMRFPGN